MEQPSSVLRVEDKTMPIVFGNIIGKTISLIVNTAKGNERSKANEEERNVVVLYCIVFCVLVDFKRDRSPKNLI